MTTLESKILELNTLIIKGEGLKAIELFYNHHVIMQENEELPRVSKQACLAHEKQNLKNVKEISSILLNQAIDIKKEVVLSEWEIIFINKTDKKIKLREVSVQHWQNGEIIKEKFYYATPQ